MVHHRDVRQVVARHQARHFFLVLLRSHRDIGGSMISRTGRDGGLMASARKRQAAHQVPARVDHEDLVEVLHLFRLSPHLVQRLAHRHRVGHGDQARRHQAAGAFRIVHRAAARPRRAPHPPPRLRMRSCSAGSSSPQDVGCVVVGQFLDDLGCLLRIERRKRLARRAPRPASRSGPGSRSPPAAPAPR